MTGAPRGERAIVDHPDKSAFAELLRDPHYLSFFRGIGLQSEAEYVTLQGAMANGKTPDTAGAHPAGGGRYFWLDVLRVFLCTGVLIYHYTSPRPSSGPFCVDGFFVMSGFFLAAGFDRMLEKGGMDVGAFYKSKARRLLPTLVASLLIGFFYLWAALPFDDTLTLYPTWWKSNFRFGNVLEHYNVPAWYMASEFALLVFAPLLFIFYRRGKWTMVTLFLIMAAYTAMLYGNVEFAEPFGYGLYYQPQTRMWQFLAGMMAWKIFSGVRYGVWGKVLTSVLAVLMLAALIVLVNVEQEKDLEFFNYTFPFDATVVVLYIVLIPSLGQLGAPASARWCKALAYLAALTYPVYLYHVPVFNWMTLLINQMGEAGWEAESIFWVSTLATVGLSALSLRLLDPLFTAPRVIPPVNR